jgi:CarD family transcriptional regulator, regulator of rRNA transcription
MQLDIGQKVAYPNQGICLVEDIEPRTIGNNSINFYYLRVLSDNSTIFVPTENAETVGIRPIIGSRQCKNLIHYLSENFEAVSPDWKVRSREYNEKLQSGDVFEAADVFKKLSFLSREKKLSFREQSYLEKSKFLVVSELTNAGSADAEEIEKKVVKLVNQACKKHCALQPKVMAAVSH